MSEAGQIEAERCAGLEFTASTLLADRQSFELPGTTAVWGRDRPFSVEHLKLELDFDLRRGSLNGVATTRFRPRNDGLREAVFDAIELEIESVEDERGRPLAFSTGDRELRIDLGRGRSSRRSITTVVRYSARPRWGLYFNRPDRDYPDRPTQIWTQGQPDDSARYFPCFDFPGERFTTETIITVPRGWFAVSNGRLESTVEDGRRRRTVYHWVQDLPHPAYLVSIAAGEFEVVRDEADGVPVEYYGPRGSSDALRRAFGRTPEMVRFFAERIGVPYPWEKYATVAIADFIFGGMENTSATTMTDTLLHDERAHEDYVEAADSIAAHELAHQWFGDLLTCREWSHGWLNESFATYFSALFVEHHRGWDDFRYTISQNAAQYFREDSGSYRRPLVENVYEGPLDIFDRHLYERGSVVLDMLRYELGDELWWKAIHHYVTKHRESDVLTADLQRAVDEATGRNMDWFFDQWVWKAGHPEFKATYSWDAEHRAATVKLDQTQNTDDGLTPVFRTHMDIAFQTARGLHEFRVEVTEASHSFVFSLDGAPSFVAIDPAGRVLKTLAFEPGEEQLKARLTGDNEAVGRIEAAKGLAKIASPAAIEALAAALTRRSEPPIVRAEVARALGGTKTAAAREALIAAVDIEPARVRRAVAAALGEFREEAAARALEGLLAGRGDASYYVQREAAEALGKTLQPRARRALNRVLGRPSHNEVITQGALLGLAALRDLRAVETLLEHTARGVQQAVRATAITALGTLAPHGDEAVRLHVREALERLLDDPWLRVRMASIGALTRLKDTRAVPALNGVIANALDARLRRASRIAIRDITAGADRGAEVKTLTDEVEKLRQDNRGLRDRLTAIEARLDGGTKRRSGRGGSGRGGRGRRRGGSR